MQILYNLEFCPLETLLKEVQRPGDYFVEGALETPLPRIEVNQIGVLSFPIPENQALKLIEQSERAPYGRGKQTVLDTSVRKVWQLAPAQFQMSGRSWEKTLSTILSQVTSGLGCEGTEISAELYKLLIYDPGSFFLPHRDTEKADGMFATLVVALPSFHRGGELVIRHSGREVVVDLGTSEVSELRFTAFYADCEHEVRPTLEGYRVCLVYNLIQARSKGDNPPRLAAPIYTAQTTAVSEFLKQGLKKPEWPKKIAWLLEHEYSPAGLCFSGLKNSDAALAKVLLESTAQAGYAIHLAVVHIEESGSAEDYYDPRSSRWGRRRYYDRYDDEPGEEDDTTDDDFKIGEVISTDQYVDNWKDTSDLTVDFGRLPLGENELLPAGALDGEKPDKQRVMEATGNAGAEYEGAYHRAALVIWPRDNFAEVLFDAGFGAAVPFLKNQACLLATSPIHSKDQGKVTALATRIIDAWGKNFEHPWYEGMPRDPRRLEMLEALLALRSPSHLKRFIEEIVVREYDGSENELLARGAALLGEKQSSESFSKLVIGNMSDSPNACVDLFRRLAACAPFADIQYRCAQVRTIAAAMIDVIPKIGAKSASRRQMLEQQHQIDPSAIADFLDSLSTLGLSAMRDQAAVAMSKNPSVFVPGKILLPALESILTRRPKSVGTDGAFLILWRHSVEFLLARSEYPPEAPIDWALHTKISCKCEDCRELGEFACDPKEFSHKFRIREDRRAHLHQTIDRYKLDMDHVTERTGSPYTLVCTKNRRSYKRSCEQYRADISHLLSLNLQMQPVPHELKDTASRIREAICRLKSWDKGPP